MDLVELRKDLHRNPELSLEEYKTAKKIKELLKTLGVDEIYNNFIYPSFIAKIKGEELGENTLFRCELDALPIEEKNDFEHQSTVSGVGHKCGHDGHITIMVGLAEYLAKNKPKKGNVFILFQSAEEIGYGAADVVKSQVLSKLEIDNVFALHNVPGYELGQIVIKSGMFTPHVESFTVKLFGATSHAGEPDNAISPLPFISDFFKEMQALHNANTKDADYFVVSPVFVRMGEKSFGTTAGYGEIGYTIRTHSTDKFEAKRKQVKALIQQKCTEHNLDYELEWSDKFYSNYNDSELTNTVLEAAQKLDFNIHKKNEPFDWGEDFGLITQVKPGVMFGLGAGKDTPPLHDNYYDFPDAIIEPGVKIFSEIAKKLHQ